MKKSKILLIFALIFLSISTFCFSSVKAVETEIEEKPYPEISLDTLPNFDTEKFDVNKRVVTWREWSNHMNYFIFFPAKNYEGTVSCNLNSYMMDGGYVKCDNDCDYCCMYYIVERSNATVWTAGWSGTGGFNNKGIHQIFESYTDVYEPDLTTVFFKAPTVEIPIVEKTTIAEKLEGVELEKPIITEIIGLCKYIIPLLVCLIGLYKAFKMLCTTLRKA